MTARLPFLTWSAVEQKQAVMTAAWLSKLSNKRHAAIQARAAHCAGHTLDRTVPMVFYVCSAVDIAEAKPGSHLPTFSWLRSLSYDNHHHSCTR